MTSKRAKLADQTSFETTETPGTRTACRWLLGPLPSAIVYAVTEFIWGMFVKMPFGPPRRTPMPARRSKPR